MVDQVDGDDGGADKAHGVDQSALRQAGDDAHGYLAPVRLGEEHGDHEQHAHSYHKELADDLQQLGGTEADGGDGDGPHHQAGDGHGQPGEVGQAVGGADLVAGHKAQAGEEDGQAHKDGDEVLPALAVAYAQGGLDDALAAVGGDAGGDIHQDDGGDAGKDHGPQQRELEVGAGDGRSGDGAGANEGAGDNGGRAHVLQFFNKRFLFHVSSSSILSAPLFFSQVRTNF